MEMLDIKINGANVTVEGETAARKDLIIVVTDYGDRYYDVNFVNAVTDKLFGGTVYAGIKGLGTAMKYAKALQYESGDIEIKRVEADFDDDFLL